jgi:CO dehydrogenase nickel-insertion accessory protein CooC1
MAKATIANGTNGVEPTGAIHLTLQGKGGVGKSLVASVLAQYLRDKGKEVRCIDTDPVNRTFAQYGALAADRLNLRDEHNRIEQRAFDSLIERFLTEDAATFVVR